MLKLSFVVKSKKEIRHKLTRKKFNRMDGICKETTVFLKSLLVLQFHAYSLATKMQEIKR
jgi:hypothetical protein